LRVHLGKDLTKGIDRLSDRVSAALAH
jgi:hypothetical protein